MPPKIYRIPLLRRSEESGVYALVDREDFDWISEFYWSLSAHPDKKPYAYRRAHEKAHKQSWHGGKYTPQSFMHREVIERLMGDIPDGLVVDHISRDRLDNRRSNLRVVTASDNSHNATNPNKPRSATSIYLGVQHLNEGREDRRWQAKIERHGKTYRSYHATEHEAALARDAMVRELEITTAYLNFPDDE